jgi:hypothetical protein
MAAEMTLKARIAGLFLPLLLFAPASAAEARRTENVVLVTVDGLRWQELFRGIDAGMLDPEKHGPLLERLAGSTPEERRSALLPFFWRRLAPQGVVLGNRDLNSRVELANPLRFSYPGYAELLLGRVAPEIDSNANRHYPHETVLEFVRRKLGLTYPEVAAFGSWETFAYICRRDPESIFVNAGYREMDAELATPGMGEANRFQFEALTPWDSVRHDAVTATLALEYLRAHRPRLLYVALGETDDWAHDGRYDRMIQATELFDGFLRDLWAALQESERYRGGTTLIVTTDHGRGRTPEDWTGHGERVPGAEEIWLAVFGPDTPVRGEIADGDVVHLKNVAATVLSFFGLDYPELHPDTAPPVGAAFSGEP